MKILVVEDDTKIASFLQRGLTEENFEVAIAYDGKEGHLMSLSKHYDLILLDVSLPLLNGIELCQLIRRRDATVPILMLTAFGSIINRVDGLNAGADDYLVKPFAFAELLARIRALTRRFNPSHNPELLIAGDLELNPTTKQVRRGIVNILLTAREFKLLEFLLQHKNEVLSRPNIAEKVWSVNFDTGTNVVDVYINYLRNKLEKPFGSRIIHTVVGMGYVLRDEVTPL